MIGTRVGVFVCDCGDRVAATVDTERVASAASEVEGVVCAKRLRYSCSPDGRAAIAASIAADGLERVVVAGCTQRLLGPTLASTCTAAGIAPGLFHLVDIREGSAWPHAGDPVAATEKAADIVRMGVAAVSSRSPRPAAAARIAPGALIVGGGVAGMTAAVTLANSGVPVTLVEREDALGGMLRDVHLLYPDRRLGSAVVDARVAAVTGHPRIEVLLGHEVQTVTGSVGSYHVRLGRRGDEHALPRVVEVGAVVVATGARVRKRRGLFGYDGRRVVTQLEFEKELASMAGGTSRTAPPGSVVMICCAGQRNDETPYCSTICCTTALKQAIEFKEDAPEATVTILFRDMWLQGDHTYEEELLRARRHDIAFVRYGLGSPPSVTEDGVVVHDVSTGDRRRLPAERVVLATPIVPQEDSGAVAHRFGLPLDEYGFLPEARAHLRPGHRVDRGIFVCGTAHRPTSWTDAEFQGISAAFSALRHLRRGTIAGEGARVEIDEKLCTGCAACVPVCPYGALSMEARPGVLDLSVVDPMRCTGCGNCVVQCPVKAIDLLPTGGEMELLGQIEAALETRVDGVPRVLVLGCEWSGHAAAELAGATRLSYPSETRLIHTSCSARFDPTHVLWAFLNGADGVFLGACPPGRCHYIDGNRHAEERFARLRDMLRASGFDTRRLRLAWVSPDDAGSFVRELGDFTQLVRALGPRPIVPEQER